MPSRKSKGHASENQNKRFEETLREVCDQILKPYQVQWLLDESRFKIMNKARQIGISEILALEGLLDVFKGESVYFISRSERQAIYLLDKFYRWADDFIACGNVIDFDKRSSTECKVNGVFVSSLTSNATTGEGFTGNVCWDEAGLAPNDREIYRSIFPTVTRGYKLRIVSRPFGQSNLFYDIYSNHTEYPDYSRHEVDVHRAKADGMGIDIDLLRRNFDEDSFAENYECKFIDESTSYFPYSLLRECIGDKPETSGDWKYYLGVDVARRQHLSVFYVIAKLGDTRYTKEVIARRKISFEEHKDIIRNLVVKYSIERGKIDATGIGTQLSEEINAEFSFIEPVWFTNQIKERIVNGVKRLMEAGMFFIPDDQDLLSDFHRIRRSVTKQNNIIFEAVAKAKSHADRFLAGALALDSSQKDKQPNIIVL